MTPSLRTRFLSAGIFFVLIASAVFTVPARADSGSPPPAPSVPGGSTRSAAQAPSGGTNTSGGGDQGHRVELSSQSAAYVAPAGDPVWCPASVAVPTPGANHCSPSLYNTDLYTLTHAVEMGSFVPLATNSNIWIEQGPEAPGANVVLIGSDVNVHPVSLFTLTLKGGWMGGGVINPLHPSIINGKGITIGNWNNSVTISNLTVENAPALQDGIQIVTTKNITLTNVVVDASQEYGAYLDNTSGTGSVTITKSKFTNNDQILDPSYGLYVKSNGAITMTDTTSSGNWSYGAVLDNSYAALGHPQPVTLNGTNIFDNNNNFGFGGYGLVVYSDGRITTGSISANNNLNGGADLDNSSADPLHPQPVTIKGTSSFSRNGYAGLYVYSRGAISVNNLTADDNGYEGAVLNNQYSSTTYSPVKVTGTNVFANNSYTGLEIDSDGAISLNNINASQNGSAGYSGLYAENSGAHTAQNITLTGANTFNENNLSGAALYSTGKVSLSNVTATFNALGMGLFIENIYLGSTKPQAVTLTGFAFLTFNNSDNLDVVTDGAITISNLTASFSNTGSGADLAYTGHTSGKVTLLGKNTFGFNNGGGGLNILSNGPVLLNNLDASFNTGGDGVTVDNTAALNAKVTVSGINTFNFNHDMGLNVSSNGPITASNLTAEFNSHSSGDYGVLLDNYNSSSTFVMPVTVTGNNVFLYNQSDGLDIDSGGTVTTSNLTAIGNNSNYGDPNYSAGVYIDNTDNNKFFKPITLNGVNTFYHNTFNGVQLISDGAITTNNINSLDNGSYGATLDNCDFFSSTCHGGNGSTITVKGNNSFIGNGIGGVNGDGLYVTSNGMVKLYHITANFNHFDGMYVDTTSHIYLTCGSFMNNGQGGIYGYGWETVSAPSITLNGVDAAGNYSGDYRLNGTVIFPATPVRTCTLP